MTGAIGVFVALLVWRFVVLWAAAVFEAVGLVPAAARFEARSALTGAGYTTAQSELVALHPSARRVASTLMVTGYLGPATILALLGVSFVLPPDGEGLQPQAITLAVLCAAFFGLDRVGALRAIGSRPARALARRMLDTDAFETWTLIGDQAIATMIMPDDPIPAREAAAAVDDAEIVLLAITPADQGGTVHLTEGSPPGQPGAGDHLVVFGPQHALERLRTSVRRG